MTRERIVRSGGGGKGGAAARVLWAMALPIGAFGMHWPTPHPAANRGESFESWAQATVSGEPASALFGCVRNDGSRFHEAIDVAPFGARDRQGEATDPVTAAFDGTVVHVSAVAGNSGYGRYVVLEHGQLSPAIYTLYAHLAAVGEELEVGGAVAAGAPLGMMGRSAGGYSIPRDRAHLHFETGLRLSDDFQDWYDRQDFGSRNHHGPYNGINLAGFDPLEAFNWLRERPEETMGSYFATIPPGWIVEVVTSKVPDFARRYPSLIVGGRAPEKVAGWRVSVSAFGVPLLLEPLETAPEGATEGQATIVAVDPAQLDRFSCRHQVVLQTNGAASLGRGGKQLLELLFGFR